MGYALAQEIFAERTCLGELVPTTSSPRPSRLAPGMWAVMLFLSGTGDVPPRTKALNNVAE